MTHATPRDTPDPTHAGSTPHGSTPPPRLLQQVRDALRTRHYGRRTEQA